MFADGGLQHTSTVDENGDVWIMGQLPGYPRLHKIPKKVPEFQNITQICCANYHMLALSQIGEVFSLGDNAHGQLGLGLLRKAEVPTKIENIPQIQLITCGGFHSLIIDHENKPWGFGENGEFELGEEGKGKISTPKQLSKFKNIKITCCGRWFSCFVDFDNKLYFCGKLLSVFTTLEEIKIPQGKEIISIKAGYYYCLVLFDDGSIYIYLGNSEPNFELELIDIQYPVKSVACGANFFLLLDYDGLVHYFEVGEKNGIINDKTKELKTMSNGEFCPGNLVAAGCYHSLIRTVDGSIFTYGKSDNYQLGHKIGMSATLNKLSDEYSSIIRNNTVFGKSARK